MRAIVYPSFDDLPENAQSLFDVAERQDMFLSRTWLRCLVDEGLKSDQELRLLCAVDGEVVYALFPMVEQQGDWRSLSHRYTSRTSLYLHVERRQEAVDCLVHHLSENAIDSLVLTPIDDEDEAVTRFGHSMQAAGYDSHRTFRFYNWIHTVGEASFDDYLADRPSRVRNTIARKRRKLEREHECEIDLITDDGIGRALQDYGTLYIGSWKASEPDQALIDALVREGAARGWLRFALLRIDGQPAAGQIWFVVGGRAIVFRLAYDEVWKEYSPGSILTACLMEQVIDVDDVHEIDYLIGNEKYKWDWMTERRERSSLTFVRRQQGRSLFARLLAAISKG